MSSEAPLDVGASAADLVLTFEQRPDTHGRIFDVRLAVRGSRRLARLTHSTWGQVELTDPVEFFRQHLAAIGSAPREPAQEAAFAERLGAAAALFARLVLPEGIRRCLAALRGDVEDLHIVADAPWIPWELLRIESRPDSGSIDGPHLAEAFAVTRGIRGVELPRALTLTHLAAVVAASQGLVSLEGEWQDLERLAVAEVREVTRIPARLEPLLAAMRSGIYDGWHFATHGHYEAQAADLSSIALEERQALTAAHLAGVGDAFGARRPLVFLNTCSAARGGMSLSAAGGWAPRLIDAGAGAFIGPLWLVDDARARTFARTLYREILNGSPLGAAARAARREIASPADPSSLAYAVFAHPEARYTTTSDSTPAATQATASVAADDGNDLLQCDPPRWDPSKAPGTLLRAEYGIVRFHGRDEELADLGAWCTADTRLLVRLYTGPGGMGKTRLATEIARRLKATGWQAGFLEAAFTRAPAATWEVLQRRGGRMLLIVDYVELRRQPLVILLRKVLRSTAGPIRVILLARAALDWWDQLQQEGDGVGDLLSSSATTRKPLGALALTVQQRQDSFHYALEDFSRRLDQAMPPAALEDPGARHFDRALLLHMSALAIVNGVQAKGEQGILDFVLGREKNHWQKRAEAAGLSPLIVPGIGREMATITLVRGVEGIAKAIALMKGLKFFADQPQAVLEAVARLLRETYPDTRLGIEPILPDLLGEHLVQREMEADPDEILDLVLGPPTPPPPPPPLPTPPA